MQFYNFERYKKMVNFLKRYKVSKLFLEKVENPNRSITIKKIEKGIKELPLRS